MKYLAVLFLFLGSLCGFLPVMAGGISGHATVRFAKAVVNYHTYVPMAEGAVDVVHAGTFAVAKASAGADKAVAKADAFLEKIK